MNYECGSLESFGELNILPWLQVSRHESQLVIEAGWITFGFYLNLGWR